MCRVLDGIVWKLLQVFGIEEPVDFFLEGKNSKYDTNFWIWSCSNAFRFFFNILLWVFIYRMIYWVFYYVELSQNIRNWIQHKILPFRNKLDHYWMYRFKINSIDWKFDGLAFLLFSKACPYTEWYFFFRNKSVFLSDSLERKYIYTVTDLHKTFLFTIEFYKQNAYMDYSSNGKKRMNRIFKFD